jgi:hypothetical protein
MEEYFLNKLFMKGKLRIKCSIYIVHFKDKGKIYNVLSNKFLSMQVSKAKMLLPNDFF